MTYYTHMRILYIERTLLDVLESSNPVELERFIIKTS